MTDRSQLAEVECNHTSNGVLLGFVRILTAMAATPAGCVLLLDESKFATVASNSESPGKRLARAAATLISECCQGHPTGPLAYGNNAPLAHELALFWCTVLRSAAGSSQLRDVVSFEVLAVWAGITPDRSFWDHDNARRQCATNAFIECAVTPGGIQELLQVAKTDVRAETLAEILVRRARHHFDTSSVDRLEEIGIISQLALSPRAARALSTAGLGKLLLEQLGKCCADDLGTSLAFDALGHPNYLQLPLQQCLSFFGSPMTLQVRQRGSDHPQITI